MYSRPHALRGGKNQPDRLCQLGTVEMAQRVRALTTMPEGMSLIPRTNMVKERNDSHSLFSDHHCGVQEHAYPHPK